MNETDLNLIIILPNIGKITVKEALDKGLLEPPHNNTYGKTLLKIQSAVCENCGKSFEYNSSDSKGRFCSKECFYQWEKGKTYEEMYRIENADEIREKLRKAHLGQLPTPSTFKIGHEVSDEVRIKQSENRKGKCCGDSNPSKRLEVIEKIRKVRIEEWKNPKSRESRIKAIMDSKSYNGYESKEHAELKTETQFALERKGFRVEKEYRILKPNLNGFYIVDVVGINGNVRVAVECGDCDEDKLKDLTNLFDMVFYKPYEGKARLIK